MNIVTVVTVFGENLKNIFFIFLYMALTVKPSANIIIGKWAEFLWESLIFQICQMVFVQ